MGETVSDFAVLTSTSTSGVLGTMAADVMHVVLGLPYLASAVGCAVCLVVTFVAWYAAEGTLDIHSVVAGRREVFYWLAVFTFAMGTALGDLFAPAASARLPVACRAAVRRRTPWPASLAIRGCPRGDLNTRSSAISPDRGNHARRGTRRGSRLQEPGRLSRPFPAIPAAVTGRDSWPGKGRPWAASPGWPASPQA